MSPRNAQLERWEAHRAQALAHHRAQELEAAIALLEPDLAEMRAMRETGTSFELTLGMLAQLLYLSGRAEEALPLLAETRDRLRARGNAVEGRIYEDLHQQAQRYLGRAEPPAPPLRVVFRVGSRVYEVDDLPGLTGNQRVQAIFARGRPTLPRATHFAQLGRQAAQSGDLDQARRCFERAAAADRLDPASRYQLAFTLLKVGELAAALALQEEVEALAPGWYDNRAWMRLTRRIGRGELPQELVGVLHVLDDGVMAPADKLTLANRTLVRMPRVAQLHLHRGRALRALGHPEKARVSVRAGLEVVGEDDHTHSQLLAELAGLEVDEAERMAIWRRVAGLEGASLFAAATARVMLRSRPGRA